MIIVDEGISYELALKGLVLESFGTQGSFTIFRNIIPKSVELIQSFIPDLNRFAPNSNSEPVSQITNSERRALVGTLSKANFIDYSSTLVSVPEGFNGKLLSYLELMIDLGEDAMKNGLQIIQDYSTELSKFLSNSDIRKTMQSHDDYYKTISKIRAKHQEDIKKYFDKNKPTLSRQKFSTIFDRFGDLEKAFVLEQKLKEVKRLQNYSVIVSEIQKVSEILTLVKSRLDNGDIDEISPVVAKNLAEGAHEVGRYAEYLAMYGYLTETAIGTVKNIEEQFTKLFIR